MQKVFKQNGTNHEWIWKKSTHGITIKAGCFDGTVQELVNKIYEDNGIYFFKRIALVKQACENFCIEMPQPILIGNGYGDGNGDGYGDGYGYGNGYGYGYGDGNGNGNGDGDGYGDGNGNGR